MQLTQIRLRRLLAGLTQVDLEELSGVSQPRISELERSIRPATEAERRALVVALDASPDALFGERDGASWPIAAQLTA